MHHDVPGIKMNKWLKVGVVSSACFWAAQMPLSAGAESAVWSGYMDAGLAACQDQNLERAEKMYRAALECIEGELNEPSQFQAETLEKLSEVCLKLGNDDEPEAYFRRALEIRQNKCGPNAPEVAETMENLATLYYDRGQYDLAEPLLYSSLAIREKKLGANHVAVARTLCKLANVYRDHSNYSRAESIYRRALAILEKKSSTNDLLVGTTVANLAAIMHLTGRYAEASEWYKRALTIEKPLLGPQDPQVIAIARQFEQVENYGASTRSMASRQHAVRPGVDSPL